MPCASGTWFNRRVAHSYEAARPSHSPSRDASVVVSDGRRVQIAEWGPSDGRPLLFLHGTPGSRLLCPDLAATEAAGMRHLSIDRPGYGRSDPFPGLLTNTTVTVDIVQVLDQLNLERVAVVGWSGGGRYALALGALAPDRVTAIAVVCGAAEPATELDDPPEVIALARQVAGDPVGHRGAVRDRCRWLADDPQLLLRLTERFAPEVLAASGMRKAFVGWMDEAAVRSIDGYVDDWISDAVGWGFSLDQVVVPVHSWYGELDRIVGRHHAQLHAELIPGCELHGCPQCGHFVPIAHWPEILDQLG